MKDIHQSEYMDFSIVHAKLKNRYKWAFMAENWMNVCNMQLFIFRCDSISTSWVGVSVSRWILKLLNTAFSYYTVYQYSSFRIHLYTDITFAWNMKYVKLGIQMVSKILIHWESVYRWILNYSYTKKVYTDGSLNHNENCIQMVSKIFKHRGSVYRCILNYCNTGKLYTDGF